MAKKIIGEDGKEYTIKEKKPFYKRVWFWVLVVLVVSGAIGSTIDNEPKSGSKGNSAPSSVSKKTEKTYTVGDTVTVGDVTYTLNDVQLTDERNEFEDSNPEKVIKVTYHVKNNSDDDLPIGADLNAYGPDNKKLETYPLTDTTMDAVAPGKEADVTTGFGLNGSGKVELQFAPLVSVKKAAKFIVKVQ